MPLCIILNSKLGVTVIIILSRLSKSVKWNNYCPYRATMEIYKEFGRKSLFTIYFLQVLSIIINFLQLPKEYQMRLGKGVKILIFLMIWMKLKRANSRPKKKNRQVPKAYFGNIEDFVYVIYEKSLYH